MKTYRRFALFSYKWSLLSLFPFTRNVSDDTKVGYITGGIVTGISMMLNQFYVAYLESTL